MGDSPSLAEWVDPATSALMVIDMQNDFCHPEGAFAKRGFDTSLARGIVPTLKRLMNEARKVGVPVIMVRVVRNDDTAWPALKRLARFNWGEDFIPVFEEGWGAELYEGFEPLPGDIQLDKNRYGSFTGTNLDLILRNKGIANIILSGGATNVCVESTAREGFMLDYNVVLVDDACATITRELHEGTLANMRGWFGRVVNAEDVIAAWGER
jgi:ureidoacrylate peracid hydrolase